MRISTLKVKRVAFRVISSSYRVDGFDINVLTKGGGTAGAGKGCPARKALEGKKTNPRQSQDGSLGESQQFNLDCRSIRPTYSAQYVRTTIHKKITINGSY